MPYIKVIAMKKRKSISSEFTDKVRQKGLCDERNAAFCATVVSLPKDTDTMVLLSVNGNELLISKIYPNSVIGELLYKIQLCRAEQLTYKSSFLNQIFKFKYEGAVFSFTNYFDADEQLKVIASENKKSY